MQVAITYLLIGVCFAMGYADRCGGQGRGRSKTRGWVFTILCWPSLLARLLGELVAESEQRGLEQKAAREYGRRWERTESIR